jgi:hypothetical protein
MGKNHTQMRHPCTIRGSRCLPLSVSLSCEWQFRPDQPPQTNGHIATIVVFWCGDNARKDLFRISWRSSHWLDSAMSGGYHSCIRLSPSFDNFTWIERRPVKGEAGFGNTVRRKAHLRGGSRGAGRSCKEAVFTLRVKPSSPTFEMSRATGN